MDPSINSNSQILAYFYSFWIPRIWLMKHELLSSSRQCFSQIRTLKKIRQTVLILFWIPLLDDSFSSKKPKLIIAKEKKKEVVHNMHNV